MEMKKERELLKNIEDEEEERKRTIKKYRRWR